MLADLLPRLHSEQLSDFEVATYNTAYAPSASDPTVGLAAN